MSAMITPMLVGILCIAIGITNMRGNISTLHSYHRHRVLPEDVLPFGKAVGLGTVIVGIGIVLFSAFLAVASYTENDIFIILGTAVMLLGIVIGLIICFRAMLKYNKGIF